MSDQESLSRIRQLLIAERDSQAAAAIAHKAEADEMMSSKAEATHRSDAGNNEGDNLSVDHGQLMALATAAQLEADRAEQAIARLDAGTYGICTSCKGQIPLERLEVIPFAELCVNCQSRPRLGIRR